MQYFYNKVDKRQKEYKATKNVKNDAVGAKKEPKLDSDQPLRTEESTIMNKPVLGSKLRKLRPIKISTPSKTKQKVSVHKKQYVLKCIFNFCCRLRGVSIDQGSQCSQRKEKMLLCRVTKIIVPTTTLSHRGKLNFVLDYKSNWYNV